VEQCRSLVSGGLSFLDRGIDTEMVFRTFVHDLGLPAIATPEDTKNAAAVVSSGLGSGVVLAVGGLTQVRNAVVGAILVDVVNLDWRPATVDIEPRETVGEAMPTVDANADVAVQARCSGRLAPSPRVGRRADVGAISPDEDTGGWVVVQQCPELVRSQRIV